MSQNCWPETNRDSRYGVLVPASDPEVSGFVYKNNGQSAYEDEEPGVSWHEKVLEKNHKAVRPTNGLIEKS
jgi:hypothetical protein